MQEQLLWRRGDNQSSRLGTMESPGEIIRKARKAKGWSQTDLAKEVGISQPMIRKIEGNGPHKSKHLPNIAQALNLPLEQLDASLAGKPAGRVSAKLSPPQETRDFPLYGSVEGGPGQIIISADPIDYIDRPADLAQARDAYAFLVSGTSMEPEYRPGDTAFVHPHLPIIGDESYVFYAESDGETRATIKHLRRATDDKWFVTQHNPPDGAPRDFVLSRKEWQRAHRVLGRFRRK